MAIWLGQGKGGYSHKFSCNAGKDIVTVLVDETWKELEMISLIDNRIKEFTLLDEVGVSPNMQAILVRQNIFLERLPEVFFGFFPALRIIDLSNTGVVCVPKSVGSLESLQYLNLSNTLIEALPSEMCGLVNLKLLDLSDTIDLSSIPLELVASLQKLQSLNLFASNGIRCKKEGRAKLEDLVGLNSLDDLGLRVAEDLHDVDALLGSNKLIKSTRLLELWGIKGFTACYMRNIAGRLERLKLFEVYRCPQLNGEWVLGERDIPSLEHLVLSELPLSNITSTVLFPFLCKLEIQGCHELQHLAWISHLPRLQVAKVYSCHGIVQLISQQPHTIGGADDEDESNVSLLMKTLKLLDLRDLPALTRISKFPVQAPSLEELWVYKCRYLNRLPFAAGPLRATRTICSRYWWENLVWEQNESSKSNFVPSFLQNKWDEIETEG